MKEHKRYMQEAIAIARQGMEANEGGPFGALVVRNGEIIGRGNNRVLVDLDPTAHAEIIAIREACANLGTFELENAIIYSSCEPCPMCLGAIYWARLKSYYFSCSRDDAAKYGFSDAFIYDEIPVTPDKRMIVGTILMPEKGIEVFKEWDIKPDKVMY